MRWQVAVAVCALCLTAGGAPPCLAAQAATAEAPAAQKEGRPQFHGLTLGQATPDEVVAALGQPNHGDPASDETVTYDSGRAGQPDSLTFDGKPRVLALVETATPQPGLEDREQIQARLGAPEYELELGRQTMYEYTQRGVRLWVDSVTGKAIGTALFAPQEHPRVPVGEQRKVVIKPLAAPSHERPAVFRVGIAARDITPRPEWLQQLGYDKVHDRLEVRCVVISSGGKTVAIMGGDTFIFGSAELAPIQAAARAAGGAPPAGIDYLVYASSHTHSAPDCMGFYGPRPDEYDAFIQGQAVACIEDAAKKAVPATIEVAQAEIMLQGGRIATISRNWRDPGIVDPYLTVVRFIAADGERRALGALVQFTCHPERLSRYDNAISADWVAAMRQTVEAALGGTCVFVNGALGGMVSPDRVPGSEPFADTRRMGEWIGAQAVKAAQAGGAPPAGSSPLTRGEISFRTRPLLIAVMGDAIREAIPRGNLELDLIHGSHPTEVGRLDIGELQILAVPGELLPDLGFRARAQMTGKYNMIVGLANDQIGYIVPAWDYHVGDYEERTALGPSAAPQIMDAAAELLGQ